MAENKIVINGDVYTDSEIISGNAFLSNSLACDELTIDTMDASVTNTALLGTLFVPKDASSFVAADNKTLYVMPKIRVQVTNPDAYEYGTIAYYYHDNNLVGKFYVSEVERTGKNIYTVSCVSAIGLLDTATHYGGMYSGEPMWSVVADIIGELVPYRIDYGLKDQLIYGHLPIDTKRNNLHQVLFAMGASVFKEYNGNMFISAMKTGSPAELEPDQIYLEGRVEENKKVKRVIVTEHSFASYETDSETVLYEGMVATENITTPKGDQRAGMVVRFNEPMHDLTIDGGEIIEKNANYAVISPSVACKLVGKAYTHTTRQVIREKAPSTGVRSISAQMQDNDAIVDNATLVSVANSENVADRVMNYYSSSKKVKASIIKQQDDHPGMRVQFEDIWGDDVTGYIKSMDITMSGILKADSEVVVGYTPTSVGNNYKNYTVIDKNQIWESPVNGRILAVLVGGGDGGDSGAPGKSGTLESGEGGAGGAAGKGGKISIINLSVSAYESFPVQIGNGGKGGVYKSGQNSVPGTKGGATTFGNYSSDDGDYSELGYKELFGDKLYGEPGVDGKPGRKGRKSEDPLQLEGYGPAETLDGLDGEAQYNPGTAYGGGGGGAAWWEWRDGSNGFGNDGSSASRSKDSNNVITLNGGDGGDGGNGGDGLQLVLPDDASGTPRLPWTLETHIGSGRGGFGGHGGGGGGASGAVSGNTGGLSGLGGKGGIPGNGSDGFQGCVIIYF